MLRTHRPAGRPGFTLIELLVVIAIIAILIGLLMAAVQKVRQKGAELQVRDDMSQLDTALVNFKTKFGIYPPCFGEGVPATTPPPTPPATQTVIGTFRLCSTYTDPTWREVAILRRLFPRMSMTDNGLRMPTVTAGEPDSPEPATPATLATHGVPTTNPVLLDPNQCLVVFLTGGSFTGYSGLSTDPTQPFAAPTATAGGRVGPFFDVKPNKRKEPQEYMRNLKDTKGTATLSWPTTGERFAGDGLTNPASAANTRAANNEPWLLDPWKNPYLYLASFNGGDYPVLPLTIGPWGGQYSTYANAADGPRAFRESRVKFVNNGTYQLISGGPNGGYFAGADSVEGGFGPGTAGGASGPYFKPGGAGYSRIDKGGDDFANFEAGKLSAD